MLDGKGEADEGMVVMVGEIFVVVAIILVDTSPGDIDAVLVGMDVTIALAGIVPVTIMKGALVEGLTPSACAVKNFKVITLMVCIQEYILNSIKAKVNFRKCAW